MGFGRNRFWRQPPRGLARRPVAGWRAIERRSGVCCLQPCPEAFTKHSKWEQHFGSHSPSSHGSAECSAGPRIPGRSCCPLHAPGCEELAEDTEQQQLATSFRAGSAAVLGAEQRCFDQRLPSDDLTCDTQWRCRERLQAVRLHTQTGILD